jgi:beta-lactam-binding protein with PASTA domain
VEYTPSEYKDLVIDVKYGGRSISPGYRIPEGSYVTLVVGSGLGGEDILVPVLKGTSLEDAKQLAIEATVVIGAIDFDIAPRGNEDAYIVYRQRPAAGKLVPAGTRIDIWLSKDKEMLNKTFEEDETGKEEEEFF